MKKERRDESFLKKPWYKGGVKVMNEFLAKELKYPKAALEEKVEGIVRLRLDIDHTGKVQDAKVQSGLGSGCDEEAIRVVKLLKFEVAKNPRKLRVVFHRNININFKIPKAVSLKKVIKPTNVPPSSKFTYSVVSAKPDQKQATKKKKPQTYQYTIQYK